MTLKAKRRGALGLVGVLVCAFSLVASSSVVINEVAWGGTAAASSDEWIELYNTADGPIDLTGWRLQVGETVIQLGEAGEGTVDVRRSVIDAHGYLLLERTDDQTVSDVTGDLIYRGSLSNSGMDLILYNAVGEIVDLLACSENGWPAGCGASGESAYGSMERYTLDGNVAWATNRGSVQNSVDAAGDRLCGTPGSLNEASILAMSAPRVAWLAPAGSNPELSGDVVVRWNATDPDTPSDQLRVLIEPSVDGGGMWSVVADHLANAGSYSWDTWPVEDGDSYVLRVVVSDPDGFEASALSEVLTITNP